MVVRAADQLQWDVGEPRLYGSAVVRGSAMTGSTGNGSAYGDDERPGGLHHLTARVYPPPVDYCVGGASTGSQLYCRAPCGCDTYATTVGSSPDYVATSAGTRRRVHDRDCASRLRAVTVDATSLYGDCAPPKRRRHAESDSAETTAGGRQQADAADSAWSTPNTRPGGRPTSEGLTPPASGTSPSQVPATTGSTGVNYTVPELVTDCSLATNSSNHSIQGTAPRPALHSHSSS